MKSTTSLRKTVYLALSGGVDSAVSAALLIDRGYRLVPVFMKCWSEESAGLAYAGECPWEQDQRDAVAVCEKLGIAGEFRTWNFEPEYFESVVQPYLEDTKRGLTPNPDVTCNQTIKFGKFFERALAEGADYIATGHYARARRAPQTHADYTQTNADHNVRSRKPYIENWWQLLTARCEPKNDQTYFLYRLTQEQLARTLFPIGEFGAKEKVRDYARKLGLPVSDKRSTRGICFVGKGRHKDLIAQAVPEEPGVIVTTDGRIIGEHEGAVRYTLGQSKGLGITTHGGPYYVFQKNLDANTLVVVPPAESWRLWQTELVVGDIHWISGKPPQLPMRARAAIRHPQQGLAAPCLVTRNNTEQNTEIHGSDPRESVFPSVSFRVVFSEGQWAPCPGQSVVFYDERKEVVLGGGIIA